MSSCSTYASAQLACLVLVLSGCTSSPQHVAPPQVTKATENESPFEALGQLAPLLESIVLRLDQLEKRQNWFEDADKQWLTLQGMTAEAQQYETILRVITTSDEPNLSQLACITALERLETARTRTESLLKAKKDLAALAQMEIEIDLALIEGKRCVVEYGEVAFVYFSLDRKDTMTDGRTIPHGLNPRFSEDNERLFAKIRASCSREGIIHLYGYSCDLGTAAYDETLAYERAVNLKSHITEILRNECGNLDIRIEANLGGIVELIDPGGPNAELVEIQRERNRVVAAFIFNQQPY